MNTTKAALLGSAVTFAALLLISASPLPQMLRVGIVGEVQVGLNPHPRDAVRIVEGVPFAVPSGKIFLFASLGSDRVGGYKVDALFIDGVREFEFVHNNNNTAHYLSMHEVPPGIVATAGQVITVDNGHGSLSLAHGYLIDA